MLNRIQLLKMLVGLQRVNDLDLVGDEAVFRQAVRDSDRETFRDMADVLSKIYGGFDYTKSPEFLAKLDGKFELVKAAQVRFFNAEKRSDALRRLGVSIVSLFDSDDAYRLVAPEQHHLLDKLRTLTLSISE
jgi:hypothetical protein